MHVLCPRLVGELRGFPTPICTGGTLSEKNELAAAMFSACMFLKWFPRNDVDATIFVTFGRALDESFTTLCGDILHSKRNIRIYILENRPPKNKGSAL